MIDKLHKFDAKAVQVEKHICICIKHTHVYCIFVNLLNAFNFID